MLFNMQSIFNSLKLDKSRNKKKNTKFQMNIIFDSI